LPIAILLSKILHFVQLKSFSSSYLSAERKSRPKAFSVPILAPNNEADVFSRFVCSVELSSFLDSGSFQAKMGSSNNPDGMLSFFSSDNPLAFMMAQTISQKKNRIYGLVS
jgi:hypothetical protein